MPIIAPLWSWLVGLLGAVVSSVATWLIGRVAFALAMRYALITGFLVAAGALFVALTVAIKAALLGARIAMPQSLGMLTYFLPPSIAQIIAFIVLLRVSTSIHRWTVNTMAAYLPITPRHMLL